MEILLTNGRKKLSLLMLVLLITALFLSGCSGATEVVVNFSTSGSGSISPESVSAGPIHFVPELDGTPNDFVALIINSADGSAIDPDKPDSGELIWTLAAGTYKVFILSPDQQSIQQFSITVK